MNHMADALRRSLPDAMEKLKEGFAKIGQEIVNKHRHSVDPLPIIEKELKKTKKPELVGLYLQLLTEFKEIDKQRDELERLLGSAKSDMEEKHQKLMKQHQETADAKTEHINTIVRIKGLQKKLIGCQRDIMTSQGQEKEPDYKILYHELAGYCESLDSIEFKP